MINRRRFLQSIAAAAIAPSWLVSCKRSDPAQSTLLPDPGQLIDLPEGYSYTVVSRRGDLMSDGLRVPGAHDGMAAFKGDNGRINLVCNHELYAPEFDWGPYLDGYEQLPESFKQRVYDRGDDITPGLGGTTTTIYDPASRTTERQFLSLAGTEYNCAGGWTPWGSWLTCEEAFANPGPSISGSDGEFFRNQRHGYVFEVPSSATGLVEPIPLKEMGRFEHEATAVHQPTGIIYLTEDRWHSLFYRFMPNTPGKLQEGGKLQALAIAGRPSMKTHNWEDSGMPLDQGLETYWIDLENVDGDEDDLRHRGTEAGAATFARGEGLCAAGNDFAFACTNGGPARLGQVFVYSPSPYEGTEQESEAPGSLSLLAQAEKGSLLRNGDNLVMAPWGDLLVCEDTSEGDGHCALVGIKPSGEQYLLAQSMYSNSEVAGVCFSPDGQIMFLNIQYPGTTVAITGPWPV